MKRDPREFATSQFLVGFFPAFIELAERLEEVFCRNPEKRKGDRSETLRTRYRLAIHALAVFFDHLDVPDQDLATKGVALRFAQLAMMLDDLTNGITHPVLAPSRRKVGGKGKKRGRSQDRFDVWRARNLAVLGIEFLVVSGYDPARAAKLAAKKYPSLDRLKRNKSDNRETALLSWRKNLSEGKISNEIVGDIHSDSSKLMALVTSYPSAAWKERAGLDLLAKAAREAEQLIVGGEISKATTTVSRSGY